MTKKILIDLEKFRSIPGKRGDESPPEGLYKPSVKQNGLKSIRELAVFNMTCRNCVDAPCVAVCPADALEKDPQGVISRSTNLCVSCKSCVVICPFGTMMSDFFEYHRDKDNYYDVLNEHELELFIKRSPKGAVEVVELEEDPENEIYSLNKHILVREHKWKTENLKSN